MCAAMIRFSLLVVLAVGTLGPASTVAEALGPGLVVLQSDFGTRDQAVAAMRGVIRTVDPHLQIDDLTHEIPPFDIWEAAYRLAAVVAYWPAGTVFVSVVDPGVGTGRRSVVAKLTTGQFIVSPDNGTLTRVADVPGIEAVREIDEADARLPGSQRSHTFHGRDVYAYVGARLASGQLTFDGVGEARDAIVEIPYRRASRDGSMLTGTVDVLDPQYGNVWTNIPAELLDGLAVRVGEPLRVRVSVAGAVRFDADVPFQNTFGEVPVGDPLLYVDSVGCVALALNQADFAARHGIIPGADTQITISPPAPAQ